jgi:hypothetical protein
MGIYQPYQPSKPVTPSQSQQPVETPKAIAPWLLITLIVVVFGGGGFFGWNYFQNKKAVVTPTTNTPTLAPGAIVPTSLRIITPTDTTKPKEAASNTETNPTATTTVTTAPQPATTVTIAKTVQTKPALKSDWKEIQQELSFYHGTSPSGNSVKFSFYAKSDWTISGGSGTQSYHVSAQDGQDNFYFYISFLSPEGIDAAKAASPNSTFIKTPTGNYLEVSHDSVSSSADFSYLVSSIIFE